MATNTLLRIGGAFILVINVLTLTFGYTNVPIMSWCGTIGGLAILLSPNVTLDWLERVIDKLTKRLF